jgi:hypothetical protein
MRDADLRRLGIDPAKEIRDKVSALRLARIDGSITLPRLPVSADAMDVQRVPSRAHELEDLCVLILAVHADPLVGAMLMVGVFFLRFLLFFSLSIAAVGRGVAPPIRQRRHCRVVWRARLPSAGQQVAAVVKIHIKSAGKDKNHGGRHGRTLGGIVADVSHELDKRNDK